MWRHRSGWERRDEDAELFTVHSVSQEGDWTDTALFHRAFPLSRCVHVVLQTNRARRKIRNGGQAKSVIGQYLYNRLSSCVKKKEELCIFAFRLRHKELDQTPK